THRHTHTHTHTHRHSHTHTDKHTHTLKVAYNDCLRILLKKPRSTRASQLFCKMGLTTFMVLLRYLIFKFMSRLDCSTNVIIDLMTDPGRSSVKYTSKIWEHWHECLFLALLSLYIYMYL